MKLPTPATLAKYGLTLEEWVALSPDGVCAICKAKPSTGRLVVDHQHIRGWKKKPPEERKKFVRGLLCWTCNYFICARGATPEKLRAAASYLEAAKSSSP